MTVNESTHIQSFIRYMESSLQEDGGVCFIGSYGTFNFHLPLGHLVGWGI